MEAGAERVISSSIEAVFLIMPQSLRQIWVVTGSLMPRNGLESMLGRVPQLLRVSGIT